MAATTSTSRRTRIIAGVCGVALLGAVAFYGFSTAIIWDGGYQLTVHFQPQGNKPVTLECSTFWKMEEASSFSRRIGLRNERRYFEEDSTNAYVDPFFGQAVSLFIDTSGRENVFGMELDRVQKRFLVVVAKWADGHETYTVADIPDGRKSREMTVRLP
jgi:hypothetical protein